MLAAAFIGNVIRVLDLSSGRILASATLDTFNTISFSPDSKSILVAGTQINTVAVDLRSSATLQPIRRLRLPNIGSITQPANFSPDGKLAIIGDFDGASRLWDLDRGTVAQTLHGHTGPITDVQFISAGRRIVSTSNDGLKIWDTSTGELLATNIISSPQDWLTITPEGFFDFSGKGLTALSIVRGLEVWPIDQFYQTLYRPDLVREKLSGDQRGLVREAASRLDLAKVLESGDAPQARRAHRYRP